MGQKQHGSQRSARWADRGARTRARARAREGEREEKRMRFLQNLFSYWANLILVETLANSRTFQRFAISTDKVLKELKKKGELSAGDVSKQAGDFSKTFREEMTKAFREEEM